MGFVWLESRAETQTRKEQTKDDGGQRTVKRQGSGVRGLVSGISGRKRLRDGRQTGEQTDDLMNG